jgi:DNA invertase Pin-like site-specific DNA recombinase
MPGRLIGYARVSTRDQSHQLQLDALQGAGCAETYVETASGAQRDRPELARALATLEPGDVLVVWKLDRLARSIRQLVETVEDLDDRGIGFRSLTEAMDSTTPGGRLMFHIFAALAEFERGILRERVNAGVAAARAQGRVGGRPRAISPERLRAAKAMLAAGMSKAETAREMGVGLRTLFRQLETDR